MMREAQKMMQDPQFKLQMQKIMQQQNMQNAIQTTKQTISDPHKLKQMELKTKLALADGEKKLAALEKQRQEEQKKSKSSSAKEDSTNDHDKLSDNDANDNQKTSDATDLVGDGDDAILTLDDDDDIPDMPALNLN